MLKQRVITALILIPLVFAALWYLPTAVLALIVAALMAACAWEWSGFLAVSQTLRGAFTGLAVVAMGALHPSLWGAELASAVLGAGLIWWGLAALWLKAYPRGFSAGRPPAWQRALIGLLAILPCYIAFWQLHTLSLGRELIILLLFLVWATDTGGYFAGKRFGHYKLAALISPKKTWEGLVGGVLLAILLALLGGALVFDLHWLQALGLGLAVALISIVGDLTVSMFKRQSGIKDTGNLFPGHGGALDRLDSMLSAAPVMLLICGLWAIG